MKIILEPTGRFETVTQSSGKVEARIWRGTTEDGVVVIAHIPLISVDARHATAEQMEAFGQALREIKAERQLVSFDMRMVI